MDSLPDITTLPLHCVLCAGAVTLGLTDWIDHGPMYDILWPCPHCNASNPLRVPGQYRYVARRLTDVDSPSLSITKT